MSLSVRRSSVRASFVAVSAGVSMGLLGLGFAAPASAQSSGNRERAATCQAEGGTFQEGAQRSGDRCVKTTTTDSAPVPSGAPTVTLGEPRPTGNPVTVRSAPVPVGEPEITRVTSDVGEADVDTEIVSGTPTATQRTERGQSRTTETPTTTNCRRVNSPNANRPVERCERAVLFTTTTPTTIVTTTTTPREEVTTTTQQRQTCTTTTFQTEVALATTQQTERTATSRQPTTFVRTTTTTTFTFDNRNQLVRPGTPSVSTQTMQGEPIVTQGTVPGEPIVTRGTEPGPEQSNTVCAPAEPGVTVQRREIAPLVVETEAPGAPVVTTETRSTGQTCTRNPSKSEERGNACPTGAARS